MKRIKRKNGVALITTLLIIAILVAVVVEFNRIAIADIEVSRNFTDGEKILFITISGINAVKEFLRLDGIYTKSDSLLEDWASSEPYFLTAASMLDEGEFKGTIVDEKGKISVNYLINDNGEFDQVQKAIWVRLLKQRRFSLTEEEINTIIEGVKDWMDADNEITGIYGGESSAYTDKGYPCKNSRIDTLDEMLLINGVSEEIFFGDKDREGISPYFTAYGGPEININTAPVPILMALSEDMTEDIATDMDAFRRDDSNKLLLGNKDWYKRFWTFKQLPEKLVTTSSNFFTVTIQGSLAETVKLIRTVIARYDKGPAQIVYWQEM